MGTSRSRRRRMAEAQAQQRRLLALHRAIRRQPQHRVVGIQRIRQVARLLEGHAQHGVGLHMPWVERNCPAAVLDGSGRVPIGQLCRRLVHERIGDPLRCHEERIGTVRRIAAQVHKRGPAADAERSVGGVTRPTASAGSHQCSSFGAIWSTDMDVSVSVCTGKLIQHQVLYTPSLALSTSKCHRGTGRIRRADPASDAARDQGSGTAS